MNRSLTVSVSVLSISSQEGPVSVSVFPNMDEKPNRTGLPSTSSDFEEEISNAWPTVDAESQNMEEDIHENDGGDEEDEPEDEEWEDIEESGDEDGLESEEEDPDEAEGELVDDALGPDDGEVDEASAKLDFSHSMS